MKKIHYLGLFLASIAISFALYGNSIPGAFVYDDHFAVDRFRPENRRLWYILEVWKEPLVEGRPEVGSYRPLTTSTFILNYVLFGKNTASFHVINILLNGAVVFLAFLLILKLFSNRILAFFGATFFAFLPIHTEAVAFIKSRDELLAALFILLSWIYFLRAAEDTRALKRLSLAISSGFYFLAMVSKDISFVIPALFFASAFLRNNFKPKYVWYFLLPFFTYYFMRDAVLGVYAWHPDKAVFVLNPLDYSPFLVRIWTAFKILFLYVSKSFVPANLSATYHFNHLTMVSNPLFSASSLAGICLLALCAFCLLNKRIRTTPVGIGILAFLVPYSVFSRFAFGGGEIVAEHWMYFPSLGLSIIAGYIFYKLFVYKRIISLILFIAVLTAYSAVIISRNKIWLTPEALYRSMVTDAPESVQGYAGLSRIIFKRGDIKEAKRYVDAGMNIYPKYSRLLTPAAAVAFAEGNLKEAERLIAEAIQIVPSRSNAVLFALILNKEKRYKESNLILEDVVSGARFQSSSRVSNLVLKQTIYKEGFAEIDNDEELIEESEIKRIIEFLMAVNYYREGNMDEARKHFGGLEKFTEEEKIKMLEDF